MKHNPNYMDEKKIVPMNGTVLYKVMQCIDKPSKKGDDMLTLKLNLVDSDKNVNKTVRAYLLAREDLEWRMHQFFKSANAEEVFKQEHIRETDVEGLVGYAEVCTEKEEYKGVERDNIRITKWLQPGDFIIPDGLSADLFKDDKEEISASEQMSTSESDEFDSDIPF